MHHRIAATLLMITGLVTAAPAQFAGPGLSWTGTLGASTRSFVPSCTNLPVAAVSGDTITLTIWGDQQALFGLFASTGANQCIPIPPLGNGLILDAPVVTVMFGLLTQTTPCLSCPPGLQTMSFTAPHGLPIGTTLSVQAATYGANQPAFTVAITGTF
ncbi:MAG: hypothetical protein KDC48_10860 [Planctomycetes bacterium]|nr:hypothetical protein [Planctomycetota bacterium]